MVKKIGLFCFLFVCQASFASLPTNNLSRPIDARSEREAMTETRFNEIIDAIADKFKSKVKNHGFDLVVEKDWADPTVNAFASKTNTSWVISFFGGIARHEFMTEDGLAYVVCHELGHHLAGHYFYSGSDMASEGSADYFAAQACLRPLWMNQKVENEKATKNAPASVRLACEAQWATKEAQDLCARVALAGTSNAQITGEVYGDPKVSFETPDTTTVTYTNTSHPHAQCRLDTAFAGAICKKEFSLDIIPGIDLPD
ncbi:M48 family metalloprotease, partial [bacterium]|nr:M48 family metalloprotease [bacterium]